MHPRALLLPCPAARRHAAVAALLTASAVIAGTLSAPPALADTAAVSTKSNLDARLRSALGASITLQLGQDLTSDDADHDDLVTPDGSVVTLDLHGHRLDLEQLTVGTGAELDITDSTSNTAAANSLLTVGPSIDSSPDAVTGIAIGSGATLRVSATRVSASGSDAGGAAGIGSPTRVTSDAGRLVLSAAATVTGQGGKGGAGIGGAQGAAAISVSVLDSRLVGRGGLGGAGIGSGRGGVSFAGLSSTSSVITPSDVGDYSRHASSIDASGGRGAAGIGGGLQANGGGTVDLEGNTDANVSTSGVVTGSSGTPSVVGAGQASTGTDIFGSLRVGRHAWLWANDPADSMIVPAGAVVKNDGSIRALGGVSGDGTVDNHGSISTASSDPSSTSASTDPTALITVRNVTGYNYELRLDPNGGASTGSPAVHVYSAYVDVDSLPSPTAPLQGQSFIGWNTAADGRGEDLATQSLEDLTGDESEDGTPVPLDLHARFGTTPHFTSPTMPTGGLGQPYDQRLPILGDGITGYWVAGYDADGTAIPALPAGLGYSSTTGRVQGTPTEAGTFRFRVVTSGRTQLDGYVSITVVGAPTIATRSLPDAQTGSAYSTQLVADGSGTIIWSVVDGALPTGLVLDSTGLLSGTPQGPGTSTFTAQAKNGSGQSRSTLTLGVAAAPAPSAVPTPSAAKTPSAPSTPAATSTPPAAPGPSATPVAVPTMVPSTTSTPSAPSAGAPVTGGTVVPAPVLAQPRQVTARFGHRLVLSVGASSVTPLVYTLSGVLPAGVAFDRRTGLISGIPARSGVFLVAISASNAGGAASTAVTIVVPEIRRLISARPVETTTTGAIPVPVAITGLRKGERFRVLVDGRTVRTGRSERSGTTQISIGLPRTKHDTVHRIAISGSRRVTDPATTASTTLDITAISMRKALRVTSVLHRGAQRIVVDRLAAGEKVVATVKGLVVAHGRANAHGEYSFAQRRIGSGQREVSVRGATPSRQRTFTVRNLKR